ncbi:MAG: adenosine kinase [Polyangiales bacterium]
MTQDLDVTGIGNAIVDVLAHADDEQLTRLALRKGGMQLIDAAAADQLYAQMAPAVEISGGSVANSMAGLASLGATAGYIGKVRDDQLGDVFAHDIRAAGVTFTTASASTGPSTARCLIFVTPDGERTLNTYLGACVELGPEDIDERLIARSKVVFLEGYLWDPPRAKEAMLKAANLTHRHGGRVALSLSDGFCVDRHRAEFARLIDDHVDILFANEGEIISLTETADFEAAASAIRGRCEVAVLTRGGQGASVLVGGERFDVPAQKVDKLVDTTGAGDLFAAGFLYGFTHGYGPSDAARIGVISAAEVISHFGARPQVSLKELVAAQGL